VLFFDASDSLFTASINGWRLNPYNRVSNRPTTAWAFGYFHLTDARTPPRVYAVMAKEMFARIANRASQFGHFLQAVVTKQFFTVKFFLANCTRVFMYVEFVPFIHSFRYDHVRNVL
jgi:hypothetical protein